MSRRVRHTKCPPAVGGTGTHAYGSPSWRDSSSLLRFCSVSLARQGRARARRRCRRCMCCSAPSPLGHQTPEWGVSLTTRARNRTASLNFTSLCCVLWARAWCRVGHMYCVYVGMPVEMHGRDLHRLSTTVNGNFIGHTHTYTHASERRG